MYVSPTWYVGDTTASVDIGFALQSVVIPSVILFTVIVVRLPPLFLVTEAIHVTGDS